MSETGTEGGNSQNGSASVEQIALALVLAAVFATAIAFVVVSPPISSSRELGSLIARRLACVPRHPDAPCGRNPLALAYGSPVGKVVRLLAPDPLAFAGGGGELLLPVDFRRCRSRSCALPGERTGLTASLRRVTLFTQVLDMRRSTGSVEIRYWSYLPSLGWRVSSATAGRSEIEAATGLRLNALDHPVLVPLETLDGRDHLDFPAGEEPPWRWQIPSRL